MKSVQIKLKELDQINFNSPKLKAEFSELEKSNEALLDSMKADRKAMNQTFNI